MVFFVIQGDLILDRNLSTWVRRRPYLYESSSDSLLHGIIFDFTIVLSESLSSDSLTADFSRFSNCSIVLNTYVHIQIGIN